MRFLKQCLLLAALLLPLNAQAAIFTGRTDAWSLTPIAPSDSAVLSELFVRAGQQVNAGDVLATLTEQRVYATQDGTVYFTEPAPGARMEGTAVTLSPLLRYTVYCTNDSANITAANKLLHHGDTVYMKCRENGTHLGMGFISAISGKQFEVTMVAGEMYPGEAVLLYNGKLCINSQLIGSGTVIASASEKYAISGYVQRLAVQNGESVERGQLLFTWTETAENRLTAPASGVIVSIDAKPGDKLKADAQAIALAAYDDIRITLTVSDHDAIQLTLGTRVRYERLCDHDESQRTGTISQRLLNADGTWTIWITPDEPETRIGLTVDVFVE